VQESVAAPIEEGTEIGRVVYFLDGKEIGAVPIVVAARVEKMDFATQLWRLLCEFLIC
jgi:D-alanyl-D-alanine carboxypeptidase